MSTAINLPDNPNVNDIYVYGVVTFKFDGTRWNPLHDVASTWNQLTVACAPVVDLDTDLSSSFKIALDQNIMFTFSNLANNIGKTGMIVLEQDAVGGRTFTESAEMKTPLGGASIVQTTTPNSISTISYYIVSATVVFINYIGDFS
jgi:hypothetical protein